MTEANRSTKFSSAEPPLAAFHCLEALDSEEDEIHMPSPVSSDGEDYSQSATGSRFSNKTPAMKRPRVEFEQLFAVRKRLFYDGDNTPTQNTFYVEGEKVDMTEPASSENQRKLFARIFNAIEYFSNCKFSGNDEVIQNLVRLAGLTQTRLTNLVTDHLAKFHIALPSQCLYILLGLNNTRQSRIDETLFQLVPITCNIDNSLKKRLVVNSLEVREVNNATSLSVNLSVDVKFIYAGQIRTKQRTDSQGEKHYVAITPYMGAYVDVAVDDLYDTIYDRTKEYIGKFLKRYPKNPKPTQSDAFGSLDASVSYPTPTTKREVDDRKTLNYLLRSVGRSVDLKKSDLNKGSVFVMTSKNCKYLEVKKDHTWNISGKPDVGKDAVFLSSFTRARIMEDGTLHFQIYSKACMYISDDDEFPVSSQPSKTHSTTVPLVPDVRQA